jgi:hypothetical protein
VNRRNSHTLEAATAKVLLTDTNQWGLAARLAIALAEAGCQVSAICPAPGHALMKTRAVQRTFRYSGIRPLQSLAAAIEAVTPDLVIPASDRGVEHLHELYARAISRGEAGSTTAELIERSLGLPASYSIVTSRHDLLAVAREEGIRVPNTSRLSVLEDLSCWQEGQLFPCVLKADGTWGGGGVRVVDSPEQAKQSFAQLSQMSRFSRAAKRFVVNRDPFWLRPWWQQSKRDVIVQSYIYGRPANCAVVCWKGRVLATICVEVIRSEGSTGPASVVRIVDNVEMKMAADKIAFRMELSGFFGLDFMIEEGTNAAYLIEMNPRATPPCHLRLGKGRDLAGALWAQLSDQPLPEHSPVTEDTLIAYFPQASRDNRDTPAGCFNDVPKGEPELVNELLNPFPDRTLLFRLVQRFTRMPIPARDSELPRPPIADEPKLSEGLQSNSHEPLDATKISPTLGKAGVRST